MFCQEKTTVDSIKAEQLQDVVITAQFEPQSLKKAVNNVRVITKSDIQKLAATNLADVLNQYLNITITPQSGTGRSTVSMFGLDGSYFKILVDNVPIVSDSSMGNNIDLTQINLDDVEQIEIIEGSMGVTHGAGAVSGILNIITKKNSKHKWEISASAQEETVGEEYAVFNKGKHIQSVKVSNTISENWFASVGFNRNDFAGYLDNRQGEDYTEADGLRGYSWLPKLQYFTNGMLAYSKNTFKTFYKFDYLNENIDYFNPTLIITPNPPFGQNVSSKDKRYKTERFYHHLNFSGSLFELKYNVTLSHQIQTRNTEDFVFNFQTNSEESNLTTKFQEANVLYSTGTLSNFFKNSKIDLQLGYEFINNLGFALVDGENQTFVPIEKRFENYDFYVAAEIKVSDKFLIRPGIRASLQSKFDDQMSSSLGLRYLFKHNIEVRTSLGKSYRVPTFEELYSKIKFSGHQFYGNENLMPELSSSLDFSIKRVTNFKSGTKLSNQISAGYLDVDDRIDMAFVGFEPGTTDPVYQYININSYKMWNIATTHQFNYKNWNANAGFIYVGISQIIDNGEAVSDDQFLYNLQANASLSYQWQKSNVLFSVYYKFNGKQQQFASALENNQAVYKISEIESYSFLDASVRKSYYKKQIELTLGARNLLDVTRINQGFASSAHSTSSDILLGYGRSYFIKLMYNLNF
jgi:outer membrane receptor for ferrienterochelin and colicins